MIPLEIMTPAEIDAAAINEKIAREAYDQANARLADVLDAKKTIEQKAQWLFGGYVTLAVAMIATAGAIIRENDGAADGFTAALMLAGLVFLGGAVCCAMVQSVRRYAGMGSAPRQWLLKGTIDAEDDRIPKLIAHMTRHRQTEIDRSQKQNDRKIRWLFLGMTAGCLAVAVFLAALVMQMAG